MVVDLPSVIEESTPTEELILENLIARRRLGHVIWPFPSKLKRQLETLEQRGAIGYQPGNVEKHYNVWLNEEAWLDYEKNSKYVTPILRKLT